jgi:sulfoxide reductase heme-binding subunit YedZ
MRAVVFVSTARLPKAMVAQQLHVSKDHPSKPRRPARPSYAWRRAQRHVVLAVASLVALVAAYTIVSSDNRVFRVSMATAYVALALIAITFSFGPIAALRGRRYPVSTDLRRDFGIWGGIVALAHVIVGLQVHLRGRIVEYFASRTDHALLPRFDLFGFANYTGLLAMVILALMLATSSDLALRQLGTGQWRRVHSFASLAIALTAAHGYAYQVLETRAVIYTTVFTVLVTAVLWLRYARTRESAR